MKALLDIRDRLAALHSSWRSVDAVLLVLRFAIGITFALHGAQKLFDLFALDPHGINGTTQWFHFLGIPAPHFMAYFVGLTEFVGGLCLVLGLLTPMVGAALCIDMLVAIATYNASNGFFTESPNGGWELDAILAITTISVAMLGAGQWSLDARLGLARIGEPVGSPKARSAAIPTRSQEILG
jgi:putative oxidoreductase